MARRPPQPHTRASSGPAAAYAAFAIAFATATGVVAQPATTATPWTALGPFGASAADTSNVTAGIDAARAALTPPGPGQPPMIAAHATPEGHWEFTALSGETYTAGTPAELQRAPAVIAPGVSGGFAGLSIVLSPASLFAGPAVIRALPPVASLTVPVGTRLSPLDRRDDGTLLLRLRPHLDLAIETREALTQALAQFARPLDPARTRVLSVEPGGPANLPAQPRFDPATRVAAIDAIEPDRLVTALASIPRQTVFLIARVESPTTFVVKPARGGERTLDGAELMAAAATHDIDLIVLHATDPLQPGSRNWFWQPIAVEGLERARASVPLADVIEAFAARRSGLIATVSIDPAGRVRLSALPPAASSSTVGGLTDWLTIAAGDLANKVGTQVTGQVQPTAIHGSLVSDARRRELNNRIVPGLPAIGQFGYVAALGLGLLALPRLRSWWACIWPGETRADYDGWGGYLLARAVRGLAFALFFLPLAALPGLIVTLAGWLRPPRPTGDATRNGADLSTAA